MKNQLTSYELLSRRQWLYRASGAAAGVLFSPVAAVLAQEDMVSEENLSDFDAKSETLNFNLAVAEAPLKIKSKGPQKDAKELAKKMVRIAKDYANSATPICRQKGGEPQITQFLALFDLPFQYSKNNPVPFCAAGVSFAACRAYCDSEPRVKYVPELPVTAFKGVLTDINHYYFKPSPGVRVIKEDAVKRTTWVDFGKETPQHGWLIVFSFRKDRTPSHIGLVDNATQDAVQTVEFNTTRPGESGSQSNGGCVALRTRKSANGGILGYVKTYK